MMAKLSFLAAKKTKRQTTPSTNGSVAKLTVDTIGCMSSLIRMFDFRRSQKLLSAWSYWSNSNNYNNPGTGNQKSYCTTSYPNSDSMGELHYENGHQTKVKKSHAGRQTMKTLLEKEMVISEQKCGGELGRTVSDPGQEKLVNASGRPASRNKWNCMNSIDSSELDLSVAVSLLEIYRFHSRSGNHTDKIVGTSMGTAGNLSDQNFCHIQKELEDVADAMMRYCLVEKNYFSGSGSLAHSNEFRDALLVLCSERELFLKLSQDPKSHLPECLQSLCGLLRGSNLEHGAPSGGKGMFDDGGCSGLVKNMAVIDNPQSSSKIVILKPAKERSKSLLAQTGSSPLCNSNDCLQSQEDAIRTGSFFSIREIKRRLRRVMSDKTHSYPILSMNNIISNAAYGLEDSTDAEVLAVSETRFTSRGDSSSTENTQNLFVTDVVVSYSSNGTSIHEKATKHPAEASDDLASSYRSESLAMLPYSTENGVDVLQPQLDEELVGPPTKKVESMTCSSNSKEKGLEEGRGDLLLQKNEKWQGCVSNEFSESEKSEGSLLSENPEEPTNLAMEKKEPSYPLNPLEAISAILPTSLIEESKMATASTMIDLESSSPSLSLVPLTPENSNEGGDEKSQVSIRPSFLSEDVCKPVFMRSKQGRSAGQHRKIQAKSYGIYSLHLDSEGTKQNLPTLGDSTCRFAFIRETLETSGLCKGGIQEKCETERNLLLEGSLLERLGSRHLVGDDAKLLFDCINEVLTEMLEKFLDMPPFIRQSVRPVPCGDNLVEEVQRAVEWHVKNRVPRTLDSAVKKDLDRGSWMDVCCETECIVLDIWETVIDDVLEEAVFDLWFWDCS